MIKPADKPNWRTLFGLTDTLFWGAFCLLPVGAAIGALLTPQDPPVPIVAWMILFVTIVAMHFIAWIYFRRKWKSLLSQHFWVTPPGLVIGWDEGFDVDPAAVEREVVEVIKRMSQKYVGAEGALRGCLVHFTNPERLRDIAPGFVARKLAGAQQGELIIVGWRAAVGTTALKHELAHRVLQICAGEPDQETAHKIMAEFGLL